MEKFIEIYNEVFNEDGSIKNCGRTKCIELIEIAKNIKPNIDFGNEYTGIMNIENILKLKDNIK